MSKKLVALVLAFALVFSTFTAAFAAEPLSADAQAAVTLGMLKGDTSAGVTSQYLATAPTRLQAAILFLRLKGLEADALAYSNTVNFPDADTVKWAGGRNIMAYLKNHPELGWQGDNGNFKANDLMAAKAYYKVMLEALGYKQTTVDVIGDFKYEETLQFAASKGLVKVADVANFTVANVATATLEALKATVKGSEKTFAASLVESGILNAQAAVAAGVYVAPVVMTVKSVSALANNKLEITLVNAIAAAPKASQIVVKDATGNAVAVNGVTLSADGKVVTVTTAALTAYAPYAVTVNGTTKYVVALAVDTTKPGTPSVLVKGNTTVEVTFVDDMDRVSAQNAANYAVNGLEVKSAVLDSTRRVVTLTTSAQAVGTLYTITVQNVTDLAGNAMDKYETMFGGMAKDTTKPTVTIASVTGNTTVTVTFDEEMSKATAENVANYAVNNGLEVKSAVLDTTKKVVTLTTSAQAVGSLYTITVQNVTDLAGNAIDKYETMFGGMAKDTTKPVTQSATAANYDKVTVTFDEQMDKATAENVANYAVTNGLAVVKAELDSTKKIVTLTTSAQVVGTIYTITVQNVTDLAGNVADKYETLFGGMAKDTTAPTVTSVTVAANTITVAYSKAVDSALATESLNYVFDGGLGYATKAVLDSATNKVTLTVASMTPGKIYNVTINNVADVNGNVIAKDTKKTFVGVGTAAAATSYKVNAAVIVDVNTIDLVFDRELTSAEVAATTAAISKDNGAAYATVLTPAYLPQADKKVVRVQFSTAEANPTLFVPGHVYQVTVGGTGNLVTADSANVKAFAGTTVTNAVPTVFTATAVNKTAVKVTFSEKVTNVTAAAFAINNGMVVSKVSVGNTDKVTEATLYLSTALADSTVYDLTFNAGIMDAAGFVGLKTVNADTTPVVVKFAGTNVINVAPKMVAVVPVDVNTLDIVFSEAVEGAAAASYSTAVISGTGANLDFTGAQYALQADGKTVRVYLDSTKTALTPGMVYELTYTAGAVADLQGLLYDTTTGANKVKFGGTNVVNAKATVAAVQGLSTTTAKVYFSEAIDANTSDENVGATYAIYNGTTLVGAATAASYDAASNTVTLTFAALDPSTIYTLKVVGSVKDMNQQAVDTTVGYTFTVVQ